MNVLHGFVAHRRQGRNAIRTNLAAMERAAILLVNAVLMANVELFAAGVAAQKTNIVVVD
jgi:hypothetical protein